jgi:hypothetical protein
VDFTREPIIESIITPKTGCKLVVRSSKSAGQEEYFVDAIEMVSFGNALFLRSVERPKAFLVPASDYEVIEVREARLVLKNVGVDRTIKIGGGREQKAPREAVMAEQPTHTPEIELPAPKAAVERGESVDPKTGRIEKRKEKRGKYRRRRGREEGGEAGDESQGLNPTDSSPDAPILGENEPTERREAPQPGVLSALLPPPPTLISETISRYRENVLFKDAFFIRGEGEEEEGSDEAEAKEGPSEDSPDHSEDLLEAIEMQNISLEPSAYGSFETDVEEQLLPEKTATAHDEEFPEKSEE